MVFKFEKQNDNNNKKVNFLQENVKMIRAGIEPKSRIEKANRKNNPKYKLIFSAENDCLSEYIPSPK